MIFPHIFCNISGRGCRKDQQSINQKNSNPFDGEHYDQRNKDGKQVFNQSDSELSALCQCPVQADSLQAVIADQPENNRSNKNQQQIDNLSPGNTQNISQKKAGIFAEIPSSG